MIDAYFSRCPNCSEGIFQPFPGGCYLDGSWSDGFFAFMGEELGVRPQAFLLCPHCNAPVWTDMLKRDADVRSGINEPWIVNAKFPDHISDEMAWDAVRGADSAEREYNMRLLIWYRHNHRDRGRHWSKAPGPDPDQKQANLRRLLQLADTAVPKLLLLPWRVEMLRELGEFDAMNANLSTCEQTIPGYKAFVQEHVTRAERGDRCVFEM